jgi:hypothetical protein
MPIAIPLVPPDANFSLVGAAVGVPDNGVADKLAYGAFSVKMTDAGLPVRGRETITVVGVTAATVVPGAMVGSPETPIPTVTPVVFAKFKMTRGSAAVGGLPSMVAAAELGVSVKEKAVAGGATAAIAELPRNVTTVPAGT